MTIRRIALLTVLICLARSSSGQEPGTLPETVPCPFAEAAAKAAREAEAQALASQQAAQASTAATTTAPNPAPPAAPTNPPEEPIFSLSPCPTVLAQRLSELENEPASILPIQNTAPVPQQGPQPLPLPPPSPGMTQGPLSAPALSSIMADRLTLMDRLSGRQPPISTQGPFFRPLLSTPNIFGDSTAGGCGHASFLAGLTDATLEHPTFNCVRANLAENNSPLPRDRLYVRYNHFENITNYSIFPATLPNGVGSLDVDRFTVGSEFTFFDGLVSLETRVPFARQLTSDLTLYDVQGVYNLPLKDYRTELLNIQFILKALLYSQEDFVLSGGLGLNIPTAQNFKLRIFVDDSNFQVIIPGVGPVGSVNANVDISGYVNNSVYNLSPFFAYLWTPNPRWFIQGFNQIDVPLNPTFASVSGTAGTGSNQAVLAPSGTDLRQQTLLRMSVSTGYWLVQKPEAKWFKGWAAMLELHYTTTLQDAKITDFKAPLFPLPAPLPPITADILVGNLANRVDILNLTIGSQFRLGQRSMLGIGIVAPISQGTNKPFDAEVNVMYNLLL